MTFHIFFYTSFSFKQTFFLSLNQCKFKFSPQLILPFYLLIIDILPILKFIQFLYKFYFDDFQSPFLKYFRTTSVIVMVIFVPFWKSLDHRFVQSPFSIIRRHIDNSILKEICRWRFNGYRYMLILSSKLE